MKTIDKINYYLAKQGKNGAGLCTYLGVSNGVYSQWNTGRTSPRKSKLPLIAEYLGVTIEDLLPDECTKKEPSVPKDEELNELVFYNNFLNLCKKSDIKPYTALHDIGIESNSILSRWRQGSTPRPATVKQIANYFGVTPEELLFGTKKEPSVPTDEELDKNDALWETYDGLSETTKDLPLNEANLIFKILDDGEQGMNFNELYAFASVLSKLPPVERLRLFQLADKIRQSKSEP